MVFSSHLFVFYFLPLALALYYLLPRRGKHLGLTLSSYLFYGWANPAFMGLMLASTVVDYFCGLTIANQGEGSFWQPPKPLDKKRLPDSAPEDRPSLFRSSPTCRCWGFSSTSISRSTISAVCSPCSGLEIAGLDTVMRVVLPLGISFYTFQSMSYTIDVYRGGAPAPEELRGLRLLRVALSPVGRGSHHSLLRDRRSTGEPQSHRRQVCARRRLLQLGDGQEDPARQPLWQGRRLRVRCCLGPTSRCLVRSPGLLLPDLLRFQRLLGHGDRSRPDAGVRLPQELRLALQGRVHHRFLAPVAHLAFDLAARLSLHPTRGQSAGAGRTYVNLFVVMLLGGLWHGAAWHFVLWGGFHGLLLAWERMREVGADCSTRCRDP